MNYIGNGQESSFPFQNGGKVPGRDRLSGGSSYEEDPKKIPSSNL